MQKSLWVMWIAIAALLSGEQTTAQEEEAPVVQLVDSEGGEVASAIISSDGDRAWEFSFHCFSNGLWRMSILNMMADGVQPVPAIGAEVEVSISVPLGGFGEGSISRSTWHWATKVLMTQHPGGTGARLGDPSYEAKVVHKHLSSFDRMTVEIGDLRDLKFDMAAAREILVKLESQCEALYQPDRSPSQQEAPVAEPDGVRSMFGSKAKTPSESANETEKPSIGEQLIEASSSGDIRTVRAMAKANAYAPASANALEARVQAKANGHRRVVAILDREIDEYYKSGAAYAVAAESLLKKAKEGLQEDPEYLTSFDWRLQVRGTKSAFVGFYRDAKKDPENALHPLAVRFDHEEFARYIDAEIDKLDGNHSPP